MCLGGVYFSYLKELLDFLNRPPVRQARGFIFQGEDSVFKASQLVLVVRLHFTGAFSQDFLKEIIHSDIYTTCMQ